MLATNTMENVTKGYINIGISAFFFTYYTLWVIGLPFVDKEHEALVHQFFPPVEYALGVPCLVFGAVFLTLLVNAYLMVCRDRTMQNKSL